MTTKEAVALYNTLKGLKLTDIKSDQRIKVIMNMRLLRPVAEKFSKDVQEAEQSLRPEGYDNLLQKVYEHNKSIASKGKEIMTALDLIEFRKKDSEYGESMKKFIEKINNEENSIILDRLTDETFNTLCDNNKELTVEQLSLLYD